MLDSIFHQYITIWKIKLIKFWGKIVKIGGLREREQVQNGVLTLWDLSLGIKLPFYHL